MTSKYIDGKVYEIEGVVLWYALYFYSVGETKKSGEGEYDEFRLF
jgi:hypothetical protein